LVGAADLLALIRPGTFIDEFPGISFFVGSRDGSALRDLRILETMRSGRLREIKAQRANATEEKGRIRLDMFNVTVDPVQDGRLGVGHAEHAVRMIGDPAGNSQQDAPPSRRIKDEHSAVLLSDILVARRFPPDPSNSLAVRALSKTKTEFSKRAVMAFACLCFVGLGVPLGIKAHRRESGVGTLFCLGIAATYFLFLVAAESLAPHPRFHPELIAWIPVMICAVLATALVARNP
jgi:lipopolysaccharide export system permease protein